MTRKTLTLTTSLLAAAALIPATAGADHRLGGQPTLRMVDENTATLRFAVNERLGRRSRVIWSGERVRGLERSGRHGRDLVYTARIDTDRTLRAGRKYTVRFRFPGRRTVTRKVKLHPARSGR
jgi:hypothetical protein